MRKQFFELLNGVYGHAIEHIAEAGERVDAVQLAGTHEAAQNRHGPAAAVTGADISRMQCQR